MKILLVSLLFFYSANLFSQQVISSSGATKTVKIGGGDFTVSWTIGEGVITTLSMFAYPNPTYNKVLFKGGDPTGTYHLRLVDKLGRVLEQKSVPSDQLELEMGRYNNGSYLIEVVEDKSEKRVIFNIVKSSQ